MFWAHGTGVEALERATCYAKEQRMCVTRIEEDGALVGYGVHKKGKVFDERFWPPGRYRLEAVYGHANQGPKGA